MQSTRPESRPSTPSDGGADAPAELTARSEEISLRNYDLTAEYDVTVTVTRDGDDPVFTGRYHLQPGQIESVRGVLDPGEYDVAVTLDGERRETAECRVSSAPQHTIHIEVGNGIGSVTEGLHR